MEGGRFFFQAGSVFLLPLLWSIEALDDLDLILSQVGEYAGWASAERYLAEFENIVSLASDNPRMGKIGSKENTRELYPIKGKYRIVYRVSDDILEVLTVILSKRQYP